MTMGWSQGPVILDPAWLASIDARTARQEADAARRTADDAAQPGAVDHDQAVTLDLAARVAEANAIRLESYADLTVAAGRVA
jgi:hypothetical protein